MPNLEIIFSQFDVPDIPGKTFQKNEEYGLSQVYFIEGKYVLRGRPLGISTMEDFRIERKLLEDVQKLITPIQVPEFIQSKMGDYCVVDKGIIWTLSRFIPGKTFYEFFDTYGASEQHKKTYICLLQELQSKTTNLAPRKSHFDFVSWMGERFQIVGRYFSTEEQTIITRVLYEIGEIHSKTKTCFVHGDYHPGNILLNENGTSIAGLIDLDWCRVGSIYEDLSLIILCFLADPTQQFVYSERYLKYLADLYPEPIDIPTLNKYMLLRAVEVFSNLVTRKGGKIDAMKETYKEIIETLCGEV